MTDAEFLDTVSRSVDARVAGDLASAAQLAARACDQRPNEPSAWHTLAMVSSDLGKHKEALYCRERAVNLLDALAIYTRIPDEQREYVQQCVFGYATSLLLHGEWEKAGPYWEIGRLGYSWSPPQGTQYWQGQQDGDLLVVCEGGYGDLFLFSRFLPMLHASHRGRIGLIVFHGLRNFRDWVSLGVSEVYEIGDPLPLGVWKYSTSIMSLPAMLGVKSLDKVPADHLPRAHYVMRDVDDESTRIGFCWRSEENQTKRRFRSLGPFESDLIACVLHRQTGAMMCSLSPSGKDLNGTLEVCRLPSAIQRDDRMVSWRDTARYLGDMTMVVTVDTAVAHLAGLLDVPTLLLLPMNVDWKWGLTGDRTPWYRSVQLFRNRLPLAWERERIVETALAMYREIVQ